MKKGLSNVISTVIIVMLAIVALGIVYGFVSKVIRPTLAPEFSCFDIQTRNVIGVDTACYNESSKDVAVSVKRNSENLAIDSLGFVISGNGNSSSWKCGKDCDCEILDAAESKIYYFDLDEKPERVDLTVSGCNLEGKKINIC